MSSSQMTQQLEPECAISELPVEIVDRIFSSLTDIRTLYDTQFVCKWWRDIFSAHPANLRKAVLTNILGSQSLLLAALRGVRVAAQLDSENEFDDIPGALAVAESNLPETESTRQESGALQSNETGIAWKEARTLQSRASVCERLEVCFSRSRKDRLSGQKSRLTPSESHRFRLGVLHAWLISDVFKYFAEQDSEQLDDEDASFSKRSGLYSHLSNEELYDLDTVIRWAGEEADGQTLVLLSMDPATCVEEYESVHRDGLYTSDEIDSFDWDNETSLLWANRKVQLEKDIPKGVTPLCPSGTSSDTCSKCADPVGFNLWNEQNWPYLANKLQLWGNWQNQFFSDNLSSNAFEARLYRAYIENPFADYSTYPAGFASALTTSPYGKQGDPDLPGGPISVARILKELFALPGEIHNDRMKSFMTNDGFSTTLPSDWLCVNCLHQFVKSRLWIWWYNERARGKVSGQGFKPDCWYGLECRTQTHSVPHAEKLNHLCFNTYAARQAARSAAAGPSSSTVPSTSTDSTSVLPSTATGLTSVSPASAAGDSSGSPIADTVTDQAAAEAQAAVADAEIV